MKPFFLIAGLVCPSLALADPCLAEFRDLFPRAMDADRRAPYRMTMESFTPDGVSFRSMVVEVTSSVDQLSMASAAPLYMQRGRDMFTAPNREGPWSKVSELPPDPEDRYRRQLAEEAANMSDVICHGPVERDGRQTVSYTWTTQTTPDDQGTYFGATHTGYFDPETERPLVIEVTGGFGHWAPEPSDERSVQIFDYDTEIVLPDPN